MAKGRKTFEVDAMLKVANDSLRTSANGMTEYRNGVIAMIERILHDSGNYHGFRYLGSDELPEGVKPGININVPREEWFDFTDETRRVYF